MMKSPLTKLTPPMITKTSPSLNVLDPETDPQDENINDIAVDMPPPKMILDVNDH